MKKGKKMCVQKEGSQPSSPWTFNVKRRAITIKENKNKKAIVSLGNCKMQFEKPDVLFDNKTKE